jgi:hypothetical protein
VTAVDAHIGRIDATVRTVDPNPLTPEELDRVVREVIRRLSAGTAQRHEEDTAMRNSVIGSPYPGGGA